MAKITDIGMLAVMAGIIYMLRDLFKSGDKVSDAVDDVKHAPEYVYKNTIAPVVEAGKAPVEYIIKDLQQTAETYSNNPFTDAVNNLNGTLAEMLGFDLGQKPDKTDISSVLAPIKDTAAIGGGGGGVRDGSGSYSVKSPVVVPPGICGVNMSCGSPASYTVKQQSSSSSGSGGSKTEVLYGKYSIKRAS